MYHTLIADKCTVWGMHCRWEILTLKGICFFLQRCSIPLIIVSLFDTLSMTYARIYMKIRLYYTAMQRLLYLLMNPIQCKGFPDSFHHVLASVLPNEFLKVNQEFLCEYITIWCQRGKFILTMLSFIGHIMCNNCQKGNIIAGGPGIKWNAHFTFKLLQ